MGPILEVQHDIVGVGEKDEGHSDFPNAVQSGLAYPVTCLERASQRQRRYVTSLAELGSLDEIVDLEHLRRQQVHGAFSPAESCVKQDTEFPISDFTENRAAMNYAFRACSQLTASSVRQLTSHHISNAPISTLLHRTKPVLNSSNRWFVATPIARNSALSDETARETNERDQAAHENEVKAGIEDAVKQQIRRPWQREGADQPPVSDSRRMNKVMTKGKLLTTPTRLLKLIVPLPFDATHDEKGNKGEFRSLAQNEEIQPLALLVHPQQPLSYLERLIQAELPPVRDEDGREKMPNIYFLAEGSERDETGQKTKLEREESNIASYSGKGREGADTPPEHKDWVRWSSSTEIGDFIRDAARGREFAIEITGHNTELRVGVPSFNDRTHYMRVRLRRMSRKIDELAKIKHECDMLAHRGAHRIAVAGFFALSGWWGAVYFLTFHTDLGWDLMEPITYLAGLTTIMGGYLWFLFINRDLSYQAALKTTISRRQNILYQERGFNPEKWESLVHEANALRREIRTIAEEYDVDWDETKDLGGEEVKEVLEQEDEKSGKSDKERENRDRKDNKRKKPDNDNEP